MSNTTETAWQDPTVRVQPGRTEPAARPMMAALGGPMGRFAIVGRQPWWTPLRTLISIALTFLSFGYMTKANCLQGAVGEDGTVGLNWSGNRQYMSACYNDILPLYNGRGLNMPGNPYAYSWQEGDLTRYMEYPVLSGLFQGAMGALTRWTYPLIEALGLTVAEASWYFTLTALVLSAMWVITIRYVAELAGNRVWDTVLVAASPLIIVHAFTNWDIPSILALVLAMVAWRRGRPGWAGVWIGVGTALKLWPLYLLGALLIVALRRHRLPAFLWSLATTVATWVAVNAPIAYLYPDAWREFLRLNEDRGAEWTTIYEILARTTGLQLQPETINTISFVAFAAICLGVFVLGMKAGAVPTVPELLFLIVAGFILVNKVWSPQYSLWLVVPAVLALPRWRLLLSWMVVDMLVWPATMIFIGAEAGNGLPPELFNLLLIVRGGFIVAIALLIIRQVWNREASTSTS